MNDTMFSGIIIGVLAMIFYTPMKMALGIAAISNDGDSISFSDKLSCAIPIFNIGWAEKKYYGKISLCTISTISLLVFAALRVWAWWSFYENVMIGTGSIILLYLGILFFYVANARFVYDVLTTAEAIDGVKKWFYVLLFPLGQYFIGSYVANIIKYNMAQEDVFKG